MIDYIINNKEIIMQVWFWIWIAVIIGTVVIEAITMDVVSVWFSVGAVVPMILSTFNVGWEIQVIVFIVISSVLIFSLRKATLKFLFKNKDTKTNKDLLIGKKVRMIERTDFETLGSVKINNVVWSAVGANQEEIEKGEMVEIVAISGNKLKVKNVSKTQEENKDKKGE